MSDDDIAKAVSVLLLVSYFGVVVWRRAWLAPLNLIVSAGVTIFWATHFHEIMGAVAAVQLWEASEVAILALSALAIAGLRIPTVLHWMGLAIHVAATAIFAFFMFTLNIGPAL